MPSTCIFITRRNRFSCLFKCEARGLIAAKGKGEIPIMFCGKIKLSFYNLIFASSLSSCEAKA